MKKRLAVFASGGGTDFQSIIDNVENGNINAEIVMLIASKDGIGAIDRAKKHNIPYKVFNKKDYPSAEVMFEGIIDNLTGIKVDYIILAGYLTILTKNIVDTFKKRIINIHPSLIPKYCGDGFYGMRVHEAVIKNGEKVSGATVHYVDDGVDTGDIIAQASVDVTADDTPETLQSKVLKVEHTLLPDTIAKLCRE